ncbi:MULTISPECIES: host cell division inhibitor Icd-like protein [Enterobacteriaceae]|uniref:host cell division inhibitor Icd-like protein n=1 Tax=Enterobacteriaceae TaxID=543 RepID=UPI000BE54A16|nr:MULTISPECIES: host cell division inhibitor Icd-like protein [Enterobacteriaceae]MBY7195883.1 host cell division inhibitor Icd-like protein [Escherichia fergusonii]EFO0571596.1 host cell division inhibitor Icd-like protein [Escherichia coli]EFO1290580.1 host cell division inhibitor Icd-like protein [Escherichia coli]EFO3429586.1 host cell division inhibitor Icd-like protein [Escherichia coli]EGY1332333.1 ash family protein [Escherichia coli]
MILNEPAAQKEAFNLASLLTNVNPQNLIKPKVVNDYLLSIVMAKDLAKLSLNLSKPDIHARGMTTNDDILNQEIITSKKLIVGNKFPLLAGGMNWIATVVNRSTSTFATNTRALEDLLGVVTREGEFSESIKKSLPTIANPVYGYSAPAKSGVGIGVPVIIRAHNTRHACFFVPRSYTCSMVDCMGAEQSAPVSLIPGYANPVQFTTSEIGVSGGGSQNHESEAAAMLATTPTQKPQFIWIIAAVRRDMPTITAKIHHIAAETEQEARRILARDHVCFFAGRIRTGGAHA